MLDDLNAQSRIRENKLLRAASSWPEYPEELRNLYKFWANCSTACPLSQWNSLFLWKVEFIVLQFMPIASHPATRQHWDESGSFFKNLEAGLTSWPPPNDTVLSLHWAHGIVFAPVSAVRSSRAVNSNVQASISLLTSEYNWLYLPLSSSLFALLSNGFNSFWFSFWTLAFCLSFLYLSTVNLCRKSTLYSPCSRPKLCFSTEGRLEYWLIPNYCSLAVADVVAKMSREIQPGWGVMKRILDQALAFF